MTNDQGDCTPAAAGTPDHPASRQLELFAAELTGDVPHLAVEAVALRPQPEGGGADAGHLIARPVDRAEVQIPQTARQRPVAVVHEEGKSRRIADRAVEVVEQLLR